MSIKVFHAFQINAQKSKLDFKEKYSYILAGTIKPMCIKDILTKTEFSAV